VLAPRGGGRGGAGMREGVAAKGVAAKGVLATCLYFFSKISGAMYGQEPLASFSVESNSLDGCTKRLSQTKNGDSKRKTYFRKTEIANTSVKYWNLHVLI